MKRIILRIPPLGRLFLMTLVLMAAILLVMWSCSVTIERISRWQAEWDEEPDAICQSIPSPPRVSEED